MLWWGFRCLLRGIAYLGRVVYGLEAQGLEHLPRHGPVIILGRRISRVDFIAGALLMTALEEFSGLTAAIGLSNSRFIAWIARQLGILATLKGKSFSAASLLEAYKLLQQGKILILPDEGEVPWDGRLQPLRSGVAWLALRTQAPIVLVVVQGGYDIWPRWARRPHLTGKLVLKVGKPFRLCDAPYKRVTDGMLQEANKQLVDRLKELSAGYMIAQENVG